MLYIIISWLYPNKSYLSIWFDFLCCSCFLIFQHLQGLQRPEPPRSWKPLSLVRRKLDESARININHCLFWGDSALFLQSHMLPDVGELLCTFFEFFKVRISGGIWLGLSMLDPQKVSGCCWVCRCGIFEVQAVGKPGMDPGAFMRLCVLKRSLEPGFFA